MKKPDYSFAEFLRHAEEVHALKGKRSEDEPASFESSVILLLEYMEPQYSDPEEVQYKMGRFALIMHYISTHMSDFDTGDFAVYGSPRVGALVGVHLLKAVHHFFTTNDLATMGHGPLSEEVMILAVKMAEESKESAV